MSAAPTIKISCLWIFIKKKMTGLEPNQSMIFLRCLLYLGLIKKDVILQQCLSYQAKQTDNLKKIYIWQRSLVSIWL